MNLKTTRRILGVVACSTLLNTYARAEQQLVEAASLLAQKESNVGDAAVVNLEGGQHKEALNSEQDGFNWTEDVAKRISLHGYAQGWYYYNKAEGQTTNSFLCKRTLLWANAQITPRWSFLFMHDFNSVVQEYYTDFRLTNNNALSIRFGQFKNLCTYENRLSPTSTETIDVYSEGVTYLTGCGSDPMNGVQYGREQGFALFGETNDKKFHYDFQLLNGSGINVKDKNKEKDVIASLEYRPCKGLNICATGQLGTGNSLVDSVIFNPNISKGENYERNRWSIGAEYKSKPFNLRGEFMQGKDGEVNSNGAYLTGCVRLFELPHNTSVDLIGSYDYFNFNKDANQDMHKGVLGLQWWFFKRCRFQAQYVYKNANTDYRSFFHRADCHQIITQMQVRFN